MDRSKQIIFLGLFLALVFGMNANYDARLNAGGDNSRRVTGRLAMPIDSPPDNSLSIVVLGGARKEGTPSTPAGRSWDRHVLLARGPVAADGTFAVDVPEGSVAAGEELLIDVDGLFLFLREPLPLTAAALAGESVRLEPQLGGAVRGTLELPAPGADALGSAHVGAFGQCQSGAGMIRIVAVEGRLDFELRALESGLDYRLWTTTDHYPGASLPDELFVEPGQLIEARIPLKRGATVRGEVVNLSGAPLAGVKVSGDSGASFSRLGSAGVAWTDDFGHFEVRGLAPRAQVLAAHLDEHLDSETAELDLKEGGVLHGVRIVLDDGLELSGKVCWPNGDAAANARVTVLPTELGPGAWHVVDRARSVEGSARSSDDGSFRVGGLAPGKYALHVGCAPRGAGSEPSGKWSARIDAIEAGATELRIVLSESHSLEGRVADERGVGVDSFAITARRTNWPQWVDGPFRQVEASFRDATGAFKLWGLDGGVWSVSVQADGYVRGAECAVTVPSEKATPLELIRTVSVEGTVLDPNGRPVAGAEVRVRAESLHGHTAAAVTDTEGRFFCASVQPGRVTIQAKATQWAPSAEAQLDLEPGSARTGHVIALTEGGALSGVVAQVVGVASGPRRLVIQSGDGFYREASTDAQGRFLVEHLAPGPYRIIATPRSNDQGTFDAELLDHAEMFAEVQMAGATVVEGQVTEILIGVPASRAKADR